MIRLFLFFLLKVCGVPKDRLRIWLLLYPDLDEVLVKKYWLEKARLDQIVFTKSTVIRGRQVVGRLKYGVCTLNITSKYLKKKILCWIELLAQDLVEDSYYAGIV